MRGELPDPVVRGLEGRRPGGEEPDAAEDHDGALLEGRRFGGSGRGLDTCGEEMALLSRKNFFCLKLRSPMSLGSYLPLPLSRVALPPWEEGCV